MERWNGKVALVTGASQGIGAAICKELVKHGMIVVGCARAMGKIETLASDEEVARGPGKLHPIMCDLTSEDDIIDMFSEIRKTYDRIDVCINNAGHVIHSPLDRGQPNDWRRMIEVNVIALCICTRESLKLMIEKEIEDGQIIHMGSIFSHRIPVNNRDEDLPCHGIYNGTKFMVKSLAETLRQELKVAKSNIKVATISPGPVNTETIFEGVRSEFSAACFSAGTSIEMENIARACLDCSDITDAIIFILSSPRHVNVEDVIIQPVQFAA